MDPHAAQDALVIVGGGLAGTFLAALLGRQGWPVRLLEAQPAGATVAPERDLRTLALSAASWQQLSGLGITPASLGASPIRRIHVSYRGRPGRVLLDAADQDQPDFGHTVGYGRLLQALRAAVTAQASVHLDDGCQVEQVAGSAAAARVGWRSASGRHQLMLTPLVVLADGSGLARPGPALHWRYRNAALTCRVETDPPSADLAWERFTVEGPVALLPAQGGHALIWTGPPHRIEALMACSDAEFLAQLQHWFGDRAGRFLACSPRLRHPLGARFQLDATGRRVVRVANAAQTLHPVAGQGFNLGLRDAAQLASLLGPAAGQDPGAPAVLAAYRRARAPDRTVTSAVTHLLAGLFVAPLPGLGLAAALGMGVLDGSPALRRGFARLMGEGLAP